MDALDPLRRARRQRARRRFAMSYFEDRLAHVGRWLRESEESDNFTYDLSPLNLQHLAAFVAVLCDIDRAQARGYIDELHSDETLAAHVRRLATGRAGVDVVARFGRRAGWYAVARATHPRLIVETGVHNGLGAVTLTAALLRNGEEGHPGRYVGTDINPAAGWLLDGPYAEVGEIAYGDSLETLRGLEGPVDLFINDSDHSADYEAEEYRTIAGVLGPEAILLGDNAHVTDRLLRFADETDRRFLFWQEQPVDHWYPGAGIGASW